MKLSSEQLIYIKNAIKHYNEKYPFAKIDETKIINGFKQARYEEMEEEPMLDEDNMEFNLVNEDSMSND